MSFPVSDQQDYEQQVQVQILFEQQFKQSNRDNTSFIFIMCDIDHFKKYNDTYGHLSGDDTLIKVSDCIRESLNRPNDFVFRLGGEEFGIIISNADFENVKSFAHRIKENIEKLDIEHIYNDNVDYVTISMGVVYLEHNKIFKRRFNLEGEEFYNCQFLF